VTGKRIWLWAAGFILIALVSFRLLGPGGQQAASIAGAGVASQPPPSANAVVVSIASANTKDEWLDWAVGRFNEASKQDPAIQSSGRPIFVEILPETEGAGGRRSGWRSGTMVANILNGTLKATIVSPAEESWLARLNRDWRLQNGKLITSATAPASLVRTPLVIAMWQSRAKALGCWPTPEPRCTWEQIGSLASSDNGWADHGQPGWGRLRLGIGYFGESNSGTLTSVVACMVGAKKTRGLEFADVASDSGCGKMMAAVERAKAHSGKSSSWLLERLEVGGPEYLDGIVTYEVEVIGFNRDHQGKLREPLVSVYPQDGTVVVSHPFAILDAAPWVTGEQVEAARIFERFLLSPEQQAEVLKLGFRPADTATPLTSPIDQSFGAIPDAKVVPLALPDLLIVDRIGEVWHVVRKHAVIAILVDKSGSMAGQKMTAAVKGAQEFIRQMEPYDTLIWIPFDSRPYVGLRGLRSEIGEQLEEQIGSTTASGGTALYDAMVTAIDLLEVERRANGDSFRYGIVVLSDGRDSNSRNTLTMVQARLQPTEWDPTGIQIHTIAIGADANEPELKKISATAHGRFWRGDSLDDMIRVYKEIAAYY
jgi:Ca-activated chloride channel homolog